jgi:Transposase and inactivated derivatives
MEFYEAIGIDVSKHTIDANIYSTQKHQQFKNSRVGFGELVKWVGKNTSISEGHRLYALEHTGLYSIPLSVYLAEHKMPYLLIPGLELKKSLGIVRGKDDKVDAKAIALYAYRRREEVTPYQLPSKNLLELRHLLSLRDKLVRQRSGFKATSKEIKSLLVKKENDLYFEVHQQMIKALDREISKVNKRLLSIVKDDEKLYRLYKLITSIKGVGDQTALFMIAYTNGFTLFANSRKFASYAGIAPFPHKSGISIRGKTRVSPMANKKFKALLSNCASNAVVHNSEMRIYYQRRLANGKDKMSTLNIIRNKLLARIFAVVERGTPYVDTHAFAA